MARTGKRLEIEQTVQNGLGVISHSSKLDYRYVVRPHITLKLHEGKSYYEVQKELPVGREAVVKCGFYNQALKNQRV